MLLDGFVTIEDLIKMPVQKNLDLIDGTVFKVQFSSGWSSVVTARLLVAMSTFVEARDLGLVTGPRCGYIFGRNPDSVVGPDGVFVRKLKVSTELPSVGYLNVLPDLVIEVLSDTEDPAHTRRRLELNRLTAVHNLWLVDPIGETVEVGSGVGTRGVLQAPDQVTGGAVLPGFSIPNIELFEL